jgi:uncharacterized cupin superfamily protein
MANKFGGNVNANRYQILNQLLHLVNGTPSTPNEGQIWYDTATDTFMFQNASTAINVRDRANHSGTQLASTISDLAGTVKAYRLDEFADATATVQGVAGVSASDFVIKSQLDAVAAAAAAGYVIKQPVRAATTVAGGNITLSGAQSIDGVSVVAGDRVLVKNQTSNVNNGIYVAAAGAWSRATDADTTGELVSGTTVYVQAGTENGDKVFGLITEDASIVIGTDAQDWAQAGGSAGTYTGSLGVQLVGSDFRANLGTGLTLSGNQIVPDYAQIMRRKVAVGFVGTTGADITINHAFALANKNDIIVKVYEDGIGEVMVGVLPVDANNVTLSFGATPTTNQFRYAMQGLS